MEPGTVATYSSYSGLVRAGRCGAPVLHSVAAPQCETRDPGLIGVWAADDQLRIDVVIEEAGVGACAAAYHASLIVHDHCGFTTAMSMELILADFGSVRYADLSLARRERVRLINAYGFLAVPAHLVMKVEREGDTLTARPFVGETPVKVFRPVKREGVGASDDPVALVTTPTGRLRNHLVRHADDPRVFGEPLTFRRVVRQ